VRHRICPNNGLGNSDKPLLDNKGNIDKEYYNAVVEEYFKFWCVVDFKVTKKEMTIGIEPAYQSEKIKIISINKNKNLSYILTGYAFGSYGTQIVSKKKYYSDYKNKSKFVKFVDEWHGRLF
jgi:hypothetical protein